MQAPVQTASAAQNGMQTFSLPTVFTSCLVPDAIPEAPDLKRCQKGCCELAHRQMIVAGTRCVIARCLISHDPLLETSSPRPSPGHHSISGMMPVPVLNIRTLHRKVHTCKAQANSGIAMAAKSTPQRDGCG